MAVIRGEGCESKRIPPECGREQRKPAQHLQASLGRMPEALNGVAGFGMALFFTDPAGASAPGYISSRVCDSAARPLDQAAACHSRRESASAFAVALAFALAFPGCHSRRESASALAVALAFALAFPGCHSRRESASALATRPRPPPKGAPQPSVAARSRASAPCNGLTPRHWLPAGSSDSTAPVLHPADLRGNICSRMAAFIRCLPHLAFQRRSQTRDFGWCATRASARSPPCRTPSGWRIEHVN